MLRAGIDDGSEVGELKKIKKVLLGVEFFHFTCMYLLYNSVYGITRSKQTKYPFIIHIGDIALRTY